jgi:Flp pilus assembly protein TadD
MLEDFRGSLQDYNKAIELNPDDHTSYYNRGFAKLELGDTDGACFDWRKAIELGDEDAYAAVKEFCH